MSTRLPVRLPAYLTLAMVLATGAEAQIVRGRITERISGGAIAGVLVTLESTPDSTTTRLVVLSDTRGEFAIRASGPGRYVVTAKRIGVQRHTSLPFALATGETRRVDIALEALAQVLPEVRVADAGMCVRRESQSSRVASLWDEARTVLTAAQVSLRDRLFEGQLTRYTRGLDPRNLRVLEESWSDKQGMMDRPFVSLSGDSLSRAGYHRKVGDSEYYYAPDADVLLSRAFFRDHCYDVVEGGRDRRGLVGIAFEPAPARTLPEVRGTIWLDARTFELRLVEFRYTQVDIAEGADRVGGEVHFGRLANGAWVTSRWFIRIPQFAQSMMPVDAYTRTPSILVRPTMHRLVEEGGIVFTRGLKMFDRPASVAGTVRDSAGRPFPGVTVRLGGTPFSVVTGDDGRFRLDSLPAGRFTLIAEHPAYSQLGSFVADAPVDFREGVVSSEVLRARRTNELVERLCEGKRPSEDNGTLRVLVVDRVSARPLPGLRVWLRWVGRFVGRQPKMMMPSEVGGMETLTDASGTVAFCDVPGDMRLVFSAIRPDGKPAADSIILRIGRNELRAVRVSTIRP